MLRFFLIVIAVLAVDQVSKYFIRANFALGESLPIVDNFFHLTYVENPGAAFGFLANKTVFFVILTIIIVAVLLYLAITMKNKHSLSYYALALVVGGAVGNFWDRVSKGTVTDMFDFRIWPVFNLADMALVVGLIYIAYRLIFHGEDF